jgi:pimeloyl-ACP methyl ester carboxylesterase
MSEFDKFFTAGDGVRLRYVDVGQGKPLLFVHGFGGSTDVQMPVFELLRDKFRCLCFDQRGYGHSPGTGEIGLGQSARDAKELIDHLGLEGVIFLGYSMGAGVLFAYVSQFGCHRLERVIIGDMSPKLVNDDTWRHGLYQGWYTREQYEKDLAVMQSDYRKFNLYFTSQVIFPGTAEVKRDFAPGPDLLAEIRARAGASAATVDALLEVSPKQQETNIKYWQSMCDSDYRDILPAIGVPAALMYAVPGSIYEPGAAEYMASRIPEAKKYPFMNATHMLKNEQQDKFVASIKEFCRV